MKNPEVLDPANAAEAEMAAVAHQCLVTALDHSNADHINIILDVVFQRPGEPASSALIGFCNEQHQAWLAWHSVARKDVKS